MPSEEEFRRLAKQELNYDAWGRLRDPATHVAYAQGSEPALFLGRGYTGHEHLTWFGLVNMNFAVEREQDEKSIFSIMPSVSKEGEASARLYDPLLGRFLSPDPYVQAPDNTQSYNRYSYALNNPLVYTDPDGEVAWFIPVIIGAMIGAYTGGAIVEGTADLTMWAWNKDTWKGIGVGALFGGLSGGTAVGVSALGGAAWWAGAAAGAVGNAGFTGLATGWDRKAMLKGAAFGAISGFVGGGVGSAIGGGWGALAGGASANLTSQLLYNKGDFSSVNWASVGLSGVMSYGAYELTSYIGWKGKGNRLGGHDISYKQYKTMQADFQRSRFWNKEYGGYLLNDGSVQRAPASSRHNYGVDMPSPPENAFASYHTHWDYNGHWVYVDTNTDITDIGGTWLKTVIYHSDADYQFDEYARLDSFVINRKNASFSYAGSHSFLTLSKQLFLRYFLFFLY